MSEAYVECLVKAKSPLLWKFLKYLLYMLTGVLGLLTLLPIPPVNIIFFTLAILFGVGAHFAGIFAALEYEYLYLDKELTIDKIMGQVKRKRVAVYHLESVEIFAPIKSYHLDNYRNRQTRDKDYSIGYEEKPDLRYVMYCEGGERLILSPSPELVKLMKNAASRGCQFFCPA